VGGGGSSAGRRGGFYALATLRRRRSLHPAGVGFQGQLLVSNDAPDRPEVSLLRPGATYRALLRFPRGAGLPEPLPDALVWPSSCPTPTVPAPTRICC
jgi:hypothetical protein